MSDQASTRVLNNSFMAEVPLFLSKVWQGKIWIFFFLVSLALPPETVSLFLSRRKMLWSKRGRTVFCCSHDPCIHTKKKKKKKKIKKITQYTSPLKFSWISSYFEQQSSFTGSNALKKSLSLWLEAPKKIFFGLTVTIKSTEMFFFCFGGRAATYIFLGNWLTKTGYKKAGQSCKIGYKMGAPLGPILLMRTKL